MRGPGEGHRGIAWVRRHGPVHHQQHTALPFRRVVVNGRPRNAAAGLPITYSSPLSGGGGGGEGQGGGDFWPNAAEHWACCCFKSPSEVRETAGLFSRRPIGRPISGMNRSFVAVRPGRTGRRGPQDRRTAGPSAGPCRLDAIPYTSGASRGPTTGRRLSKCARAWLAALLAPSRALARSKR